MIGPFPPGGKGSLRKLLNEIGEDDKALKESPLFKEGYDQGYADAQEAHRKLYTALSAVYQIGEDQ